MLQLKNNIIAYSEIVFVALGIQHAVRVPHIVIRGLPGSNIFFLRYLTNGTICEKKKRLLNIPCVCVEKKNQIDATEWFIAPIVWSTCFGHFYAHHQELEATCVLLPPMVCNALVAGCRRSGAGQQAMHPG